jgi:hypothetical protein
MQEDFKQSIANTRALMSWSAAMKEKQATVCDDVRETGDDVK